MGQPVSMGILLPPPPHTGVTTAPYCDPWDPCAHKACPLLNKPRSAPAACLLLLEPYLPFLARLSANKRCAGVGVSQMQPEKLFSPSSPSCLRPSQSSILQSPWPSSAVQSYSPFLLHPVFNYPSHSNEYVKYRKRETWQFKRMCSFRVRDNEAPENGVFRSSQNLGVSGESL